MHSGADIEQTQADQQGDGRPSESVMDVGLGSNYFLIFFSFLVLSIDRHSLPGVILQVFDHESRGSAQIFQGRLNFDPRR